MVTGREERPASAKSRKEEASSTQKVRHAQSATHFRFPPSVRAADATLESYWADEVDQSDSQKSRYLSALVTTVVRHHHGALRILVGS